MIHNVREAYRIVSKIRSYGKYNVIYCCEDDISYFFTYAVHGLPVLRIYKETGDYEEIFWGQNSESSPRKEIHISKLKQVLWKCFGNIF